MMDRISICEVLAKWKEIDPFLKWRVTGTNSQEGSTVYLVGLERNHLLGVAPVWGQTLNSDLYCQQLDHLKQAVDQKRPELANRREVVPSGQCHATHFCSDSPETLGA
ncbi:hypothetical protein TNCV_961931 [Trichonephila clavipes]|nr:hypothetical protein TNCV_961931 [Trichonephila clavipes]